MRHKKKIICAVMMVITGVINHYTAIDSPLRSKPSSLYPEGNVLRADKVTMEMIGNAEECRRDPYLCPANKWTAGIGHAGQDVRPDVKQYSLAQIEAWYASDLLDAQSCLEINVESKIHQPLPHYVFQAYLSFIFNTGCYKFLHYPVYTLLLQKQYQSACERMKLYFYAANVPQPGLKTRRGKESALCLLK